MKTIKNNLQFTFLAVIAFLISSLPAKVFAQYDPIYQDGTNKQTIPPPQQQMPQTYPQNNGQFPQDNGYNQQNQGQYNHDDEITNQDFYNELSPYGNWMDYQNFGRVWRPRLGNDFRPYMTNGYWSYSNEGWFWNSGYQWGWAPFHYGRWIFDNLYGWMWVPGYTWSPAWVTWGAFDDFYSWAPLAPGVNINIQFGNWKPPYYYWNTCHRNNIYERNLFGFMMGRDFMYSNYGRVSIINNYYNTRSNGYYYNRGPEIREVEHFTNRRIETIYLRNGNMREQGRTEGRNMNVYRPNVENRNNRPRNNYPTNGYERNREINNPENLRTNGQQQNNGREFNNQLPINNAPTRNFDNRQQNNGNLNNNPRRENNQVLNNNNRTWNNNRPQVQQQAPAQPRSNENNNRNSEKRNDGDNIRKEFSRH